MCKSVDYYLSKGFDQRTAEYFVSGRKTITHVLPNDDFTLTISFDNGEKRLLDIKPVLKPGTVFAFLSEPSNFARVYLDDCHSIAWDIDPSIDSKVVLNNKIDLCPDTCYMDSVPINQVSADDT